MTKQPKVFLDDFKEMLDFEPEPSISNLIPVKSGNVISEMNFDQMESFPDHKFKLYTGKRAADMVDSIRQFGILLPIIIWHTNDGKNIILSGHNRKKCAQAAQLTKGPVIIKENLTYEEAVLIVIETNLYQRSFADLSECERSYCLFEHYKAMKSQGRRTDLIAEIEMLMNPLANSDSTTSADFSRSGSRKELAEQYGLTEDRVAKYIRVGEYLDTPLMELFDSNAFTLSVANTLSFIIDKERQSIIAKLITSENYKVDGKKADLLRSYYEIDKLTSDLIVQILSGVRTIQSKSHKVHPVKIKSAIIKRYFTANQSIKEIEETIERALTLYFDTFESEKEVIDCPQ